MLRNPSTIFSLSAFSNINKSILKNLKKTQHNFFACQLFPNIKKIILMNLKKT